METSLITCEALKGCKIYAYAGCSVFEQGGILILPHLLWHWALNLVFPDSSKEQPHSVAAYDKSIYDSFVLKFSKSIIKFMQIKDFYQSKIF